MVGTYGMSDSFGMVKLQDSGFRYQGGGEAHVLRPPSKLVDEEIISIIKIARIRPG